MDASELEPSGIGGWLILPALGLVFSPIRTLFESFSSFRPLFVAGTWDALTSPESDAYHPLWAPLIIFEIAYNVAFIACTIWLGWLFFNKKESTPRFFSLWLLATAIFLIVDVILSNQIPLIAEQNDPATARAVGQSIVSAIVWIPYFMKSKRVKNTFVE